MFILVFDAPLTLLNLPSPIPLIKCIFKKAGLPCTVTLFSNMFSRQKSNLDLMTPDHGKSNT